MKSFREFVAEERTFPSKVRLVKPTPDADGGYTSGSYSTTVTHFGSDYIHPFQQTRRVPISKIIWNEPGKFEPDLITPASRKNIDGMKKTLKRGDNLSPINVIHEKGRFRVIDGHHRLQAHIETGRRHIRVNVIDPRVVRPASPEDL